MVLGVWCLVMGVLAHGAWGVVTGDGCAWHGARGMVTGDGCVGSWCQGYGVW